MGAMGGGEGKMVLRGRTDGAGVREFTGLGAEIGGLHPEIPPHAMGRGTAARRWRGGAGLPGQTGIQDGAARLSAAPSTTLRVVTLPGFAGRTVP